MVVSNLEIALTLLQLVALTLPAIAILMQVINQFQPKKNTVQLVEFGWAWASMGFLLIGGLLLLAYTLGWVAFGKRVNLLLLGGGFGVGFSLVCLTMAGYELSGRAGLSALVILRSIRDKFHYLIGVLSRQE